MRSLPASDVKQAQKDGPEPRSIHIVHVRADFVRSECVARIKNSVNCVLGIHSFRVEVAVLGFIKEPFVSSITLDEFLFRSHVPPGWCAAVSLRLRSQTTFFRTTWPPFTRVRVLPSFGSKTLTSAGSAARNPQKFATPLYLNAALRGKDSGCSGQEIPCAGLAKTMASIKKVFLPCRFNQI